MNMTDVFNGIGELSQWSFQFIEGLGNKPNAFFWAIIIGLLLLWLKMQANFNKEAEKNNTLK